MTDQFIIIFLLILAMISLKYFRRFWVILFVLLNKCWFPIFTTLFAVFLFDFTLQGKDVIAEVEFHKSGIRSFTSLFALWMWAFNSHKLARTTIDLLGTYNLSGKRDRLARLISSYFPGVLGFLPFLASFITFIRIQKVPDPIILTMLVIEAWFFLIFLLIRRKKAHGNGPSLKTLHALSFYLFFIYGIFSKPVNNLFNKILRRGPQIAPDLRIEKFEYKEHWRRSMNGEQILNWSLHAILYLLIAIWPIIFGGFFGPIGLVFIALSFFTILGTVFSYLRKRTGLPGFQILLIIVVVFTLVNDNNKSGIVDNNHMDDREELNQHFENWVLNKALVNDTIEVTLVAAEGGGLRSAYWTYSVLRQLQLDNPEFRNNLYAISSVSGGSVGAALFCTELSTGLTDSLIEVPIINDDNLSPMVAGLLYVELVQSIIPVDLQNLDRSKVMDKTFATNWENKHQNNQYWEGEFLNVWSKDPNLPALFINTTKVEDGRGAIFSNLKFDTLAIRSIDMMHIVASEPSFTSVIGLSCRSPFFQPAGEFEYENGKTWGHIADGGYSENSGIGTIYQVYLNLRKLADDMIAEGKVVNIKFNIIFISNVILPKNDQGELLHEARMPMNALIHSSYAGGFSYAHIADLTINKINPDDHYFEIKLNRDNVELPLGWFFSDKSRGEIVRQLNELSQNKEYILYQSLNPLSTPYLSPSKKN